MPVPGMTPPVENNIVDNQSRFRYIFFHEIIVLSRGCYEYLVRISFEN